jgi:phosphate transport system substrate-binding protein
VKTSRTAAAAILAASGLLAVAACGTDNNTTSSSTVSTTADAAPDVADSPSAGSGSPASTTTPACAPGSLSAQGSTFQANMETQWSKDFGALCRGAQVNYQGTGSGAGIQAIGNNTADFAGSDVTMKATEQSAANAACGSPAITLPITAGGVAIVYNLKGISDLKLSAKTLAGVFQGKITKWNDPAIVADNAGTTLPSTPISVFYRNDSSGTTSVFTSFLQQVAGSDWALASSKTVSFFSSAQGAKGSAGVATGVSQTAGGITYDEESYAKGQNLPVALVKGAGSDFASPTTDAVSKAIGEGFTIVGTGNDLAGKMDYTKMIDGYPISTVSYAIVCSKYKDAAKGGLVKAYLSYAASKGQSAADGLGYAALPADLVTKVQASLEAVS